MNYLVTRNMQSDNMPSVFSDFFGDFFSSPKYPSVDISEDDGKYTIVMDVAPYKKENVKVEVDKHVLTISSDEVKENKSEDKDRKYISKEIERVSFSRSFSLSEDIDEEKITAESKDGMLTIELPKSERSQKGKVEIAVK